MYENNLLSLLCSLSPYSYDESCLSSSQDHIPLAALPLLATSAPQYQDAVATVILRANQVYSDFIRSLEGESFNGQVSVKPEGVCCCGVSPPARCVYMFLCFCVMMQVCVIGDCVGGILGFDALCSSSVTVSESQNSSRRGSAISVQVSASTLTSDSQARATLEARFSLTMCLCSLSVFVSQDTDLLSPGIVINSVSPSSPSLEGSRHLSRSNIDIPRCSGPDDPKRQLPRKRSDSSTYELDTIKHHQAFLSR